MSSSLSSPSPPSTLSLLLLAQQYQQPQPSGELHLILGPMFSSKTTELIRQVEKYSAAGVGVLAVNHSFDDRYGTSVLYTHDGKHCSGYRTNNLSTLFDDDKYKNARVVCIDESNFFPNLVEHVTRMVDVDGKIVYVAGLNGSFDRKPLGETLNLLPLVNSVTFLQSVCQDCAVPTPGIFSHLTISDPHADGNIVVGGGDKYKPVCRAHHLKPVMK